MTTQGTFAEVAPDGAGWCQRWDSGQHSWRHRSEGGFRSERFAVEAIDEADAKDYVVANHYSASYPNAKARYGLFGPDDDLVGVAVFSIPAQERVLPRAFPGLAPMTESLELGRLVLADEVPANGESWFLARCFDALLAGGVRGVVSFSDPVPRVVDGEVVFPGHIGTIYQASNALYSGRSKPDTMAMFPDGTVLPRRAMSKVRKQDKGHDYVERGLVARGARAMRAGEDPAAWLETALDATGARRVRHGGQHRYLFPLGTNARARGRVDLGYARLPYPKAADQAA